jgi:hypothetical protein
MSRLRSAERPIASLAPGARAGVLLTAALLLLASACATRPYRYEPIDSVDFRSRAETQQSGNLRVTAAVPSAEESKKLFGIPVYRRGIQPVWIEVENTSSERVRFAPVGVDDTYFSPLEVAYMHRKLFSKRGHQDMERRFHEIAMPRQIWPGETRSGFVFTHVSPGTKGFNVDLFSMDEDHSFTFFINVPGFTPDHAEVDFAGLYTPGQIHDYDLDGFRAAQAEIACCATDQSGAQRGLPLNVVFVGEGLDVLQALLRADWYERTRAEKPAEVANEQHWDGRPPDAVFRIGRARTGDRNELRVWLAPMRVEGEPVWVGQITRYIGQSTEIGRALIDPRLDPNIDEARDYMLQILWYAQGLQRYAWYDTGEPVDIEQPSSDFKGVRYFTNGYRVVLWPSGPPISLLEAYKLPWDDLYQAFPAEPRTSLLETRVLPGSDAYGFEEERP